MRDPGAYGRHLREVVDSYRRLPATEQRIYSRRLNSEPRPERPSRAPDERVERREQ